MLLLAVLAAGTQAALLRSAPITHSNLARSAVKSQLNGLFGTSVDDACNVCGSSHTNVARVRGGARMSEAVVDVADDVETYQFEAEVAKVMDIIINSLYSDKDIFLRELISNASDACDKKRFLSLSGDSTAYDGRVRVIADKETNTLTIEDNGIGMTRKDLQNNLGRIAQSGTKKFTEALGSTKSDSTNLIGQFGVGFYSAFLVAEKVTVVTKSEDGEQLRWESTEASSYTISKDESEPIEATGTRLVLHMKEEADKYLDDFTVRDMLKKYSEFISFPIELWTEKTEYDTVPDPEAEVKEGEEPPTKSVPRKTNVWEKVNGAKPLWMRPPKEVSDEEYEEFYKTTFRAYDAPDAHMHFSLEGQVEFRALLFCPGTVPWELSQDMFNDKVKPMKLFVKRVFISDNFEEQLLPRWLSFLKGVVDSEDLPLNVSRELLQKSKVLSIISKRLVRKALDMFNQIAKDEDKFANFNKNFGRYIKVGVIEDRDNKDALLKLATFSSTAVDEKGTTLPGYKERMKEGQTKIYYISGASKEAAAASPVLEGLKKKGYEVIVAIDQVDEVALQGVGSFEGMEVVDAAKESADVGEQTDEEKAETEAAKKTLEQTCSFVKETLGAKVDKVEVSTRLTKSPSALVQPQWGMSPQMQRLMKAQQAAGGDDFMGAMSANLELNPKHAAVLKLKEMIEEDKEAKSTKDFAALLFDVAAVSSGYEVTDPAGFAKRVVTLMSGVEEEDEGEEAPEEESSETVEEELAFPDEQGPINAEVIEPK